MARATMIDGIALYKHPFTFWCTYTDDGFYTDCDCIPTHWMLLPAPPEKEGDR